MRFDFASRPPLIERPRPPLLVLLHGLGSDEHDLLGLASELDPSVFVLCLRAPHRMEYGGYAWFGIDFLPDGRKLIDEGQAFESCHGVGEAIKAISAELGIQPSLTILGGFSQGAMISAGVVLSNPELVDAAWLMSGRYLPKLDSGCPPHRTLPILAQHGIYDDVLPVEDGRELSRILADRGHRLSYTEYPIAHQISYESLEEAKAWMARLLVSG